MIVMNGQVNYSMIDLLICAWSYRKRGKEGNSTDFALCWRRVWKYVTIHPVRKQKPSPRKRYVCICICICMYLYLYGVLFIGD